MKASGSDQATEITLSNIIRDTLRYCQKARIEVDLPATVRVTDHAQEIALDQNASVFRPSVLSGRMVKERASVAR